MWIWATLAAMAAYRAVDTALPGTNWVAVAVLLGVLALIARCAGLTLDDVGLGRDTWRTGLLWAAAEFALAGAVFLTVLAVPALRDSVAGTGGSRSQALFAATVTIPLGTVLLEEFAFRGVLWGQLRAARGPTFATAVSSVLFGLWHVPVSLGGGAANDVVSGATGTGFWGVAARVTGTVLFTGAAGVVFCELRRRSGSLLAPIALHWAVNGLGELAAAG